MSVEIIPGTWTLDTSHSEIGFVVRHAGISKVHGYFSEADGTLRVGASLEASSVSGTVRTASFSSGNETRDEHVKQSDFFDIDQFPEMTFASTGVVGTAESFTLTGDLTIKGITKSIDLEIELGGVAVDPYGVTRVGFSASGKISRKDFGMIWNAALDAGGVLVSDTVTIAIEAAFTKTND